MAGFTPPLQMYGGQRLPDRSPSVFDEQRMSEGQASALDLATILAGAPIPSLGTIKAGLAALGSGVLKGAPLAVGAIDSGLLAALRKRLAEPYDKFNPMASNPITKNFIARSKQKFFPDDRVFNMDVPLSSIVSDQPDINVRRIRGILNDPEVVGGQLPEVLDIGNGEYQLLDGNHRISAAALRGDPNAKVQVSGFVKKAQGGAVQQRTGWEVLL